MGCSKFITDSSNYPDFYRIIINKATKASTRCAYLEMYGFKARVKCVSSMTANLWWAT